MSDWKQSLYLIADEMRGMASMGRHFAGNVYEVERAHRIMELAARLAALAEEQPAETLQALFEAEPWNRFSPAIGVEAVVLNPQGEMLLIRRRDNGLWALPGGIAEIGQTLPEAALRELWEEAGLRGRVVRLLAVFDGPRSGTRAKVHLVHVNFLVECADLSPQPGLEATEARFFSRDALPEAMHAGHEVRVPKCFDCLSGDSFFDPADSASMTLGNDQRPANP